MNFHYSFKIKLIVIFLVLTTLKFNIKNCFDEIKIYQKNNGIDEISQYDRRIRKIKDILPPSDIVGFVTDEEFEAKFFFLAQYALAPIFVVRGTEPEIIVAIFNNPSGYIQSCENNKLFLLRKIDDNIMLLGKILK